MRCCLAAEIRTNCVLSWFYLARSLGGAAVDWPFEIRVQSIAHCANVWISALGEFLRFRRRKSRRDDIQFIESATLHRARYWFEGWFDSIHFHEIRINLNLIQIIFRPSGRWRIKGSVRCLSALSLSVGHRSNDSVRDSSQILPVLTVFKYFLMNESRQLCSRHSL